MFIYDGVFCCVVIGGFVLFLVVVCLVVDSWSFVWVGLGVCWSDDRWFWVRFRCWVLWWYYGCWFLGLVFCCSVLLYGRWWFVWVVVGWGSWGCCSCGCRCWWIGCWCLVIGCSWFCWVLCWWIWFCLFFGMVLYSRKCFLLWCVVLGVFVFCGCVLWCDVLWFWWMVVVIDYRDGYCWNSSWGVCCIMWFGGGWGSVGFVWWRWYLVVWSCWGIVRDCGRLVESVLLGVLGWYWRYCWCWFSCLVCIWGSLLCWVLLLVVVEVGCVLGWGWWCCWLGLWDSFGNGDVFVFLGEREGVVRVWKGLVLVLF